MTRASKTNKFFKHQSGQIHAVQLEMNQVLEATKIMVEKVKSDPPPRESLHPIDQEAGFYRVVSGKSDHPELIDEIILPRNKGLLNRGSPKK